MISLKKFTEMGTGREVFVNPEHVTLVIPRNNGSCLRVLGQQYNVEVQETIGHVVAALQDVPFPELSATPRTPTYAKGIIPAAMLEREE